MKMGVPARPPSQALRRGGRATGHPSGGTAGLGPKAYPKGTSQREPVLSLLKEHPRTPGKTSILFVLAALRSVPQGGSQFGDRSKHFMKFTG